MGSETGQSAASGLVVVVNMLLANVCLVGTLHLLQCYFFFNPDCHIGVKRLGLLWSWVKLK